MSTVELSFAKYSAVDKGLTCFDSYGLYEYVKVKTAESAIKFDFTINPY